jgi:hypothetical protein
MPDDQKLEWFINGGNTIFPHDREGVYLVKLSKKYLATPYTVVSVRACQNGFMIYVGGNFHFDVLGGRDNVQILKWAELPMDK